MGFNFQGAIIQSEGFTSDGFAQAVGASVVSKNESTWGECLFGIFHGCNVMFHQEGDRTLIMLDDFGLLASWIENAGNIMERTTFRVLADSTGLTFTMSESAMVFVFQWFDPGGERGVDYYTFEGGFKCDGDNRLEGTSNN